MMTPANIDHDQLKSEYEKGKSTAQLAKVFGCSQAAISRRLRKIGVKARPFSTKGMKTSLGMKRSEETKEKLRQFRLGSKQTEQQKEKVRQWMLLNNPFRGKKHTEASKEKQRSKMKGRKLEPAHREKVLVNLRKTWANPPRGAESSGWKGGITPVNAKIRSSREMDLWRKAVKERDDYTCVLCGHRDKSNHADHIKRFSDFPELRFAIDNGRTLCEPCHRKTPTYGGRKKLKS